MNSNKLHSKVGQLHKGVWGMGAAFPKQVSAIELGCHLNIAGLDPV